MSTLRRPSRAPAALAAGVLFLLLGASLAAADGRALPDADPRPPTEWTGTGDVPPYAPATEHDPEGVRAWATRALAAGRARAGTRSGGDWILSGAFARLEALGESTALAPLCEEAAAAYPPGDVSAVVAWAMAGRLRLTAGDVGAAEQALAAIEDHRRALTGPGPGDADPGESLRWSVARRVLAADVVSLAAEVAAARGRHAEAAAGLEDLARRAEVLAAARPRLDAGTLLHRAADLRRRAGEKDRAREDVSAALEAATSDHDVAHRSFWRLFLDHDALAEDGSLRVLTTWPGGSFEEDLEAVLRGLAGNPFVGRFLLTVGSSALRCDRPDAAFRAYDLALRDRTLLEQARTDRHVARGLLPGFQAALGLRRYDAAERWLDDVERVGALPREEIDALRLDVRTVREADAANLRREEAARTEAEEASARDEEPASDSGRGRLAARDGEPAGSEGPDDLAGPPPAEAGEPTLPGLLAFAAVAFVVLLLLRRRAP